LHNGRDVDAESVQRQLDRIIASPAFRATARRREFLRYIIEQDAAGRVGNLKGYAIAVSVYGRDPKFDPRIDPLVRIEAGRLRAELDAYYRTEGKDDPVIIEIPKGANAPKYTLRASLDRHEPGQPDAAGAGIELPTVKPGASEDAPLPSLPGDAPASLQPARRKHAAWVIALGALVIAVASMGAFLFSRYGQELRPEGKLASVAVLPFVASDSSQTYFASGLSQELAVRLFQFPSLVVTPPSSISPQAIGDMQAARRSLGTSVYVEGSVHRGPQAVRVTARLINTASGTLLWAETFDRPVEADQVLEIQDEIASRIASQLGANLGAIARNALENTMAKPPGSMDALDCVLRFHHHQTKMAARTHAGVRECLEATIVREPNYPEAWASLASIYAQEYRLGFNPRPEGKPALQRARDAAEHALMLSPSNPSAMMVRATTMYDDGDMAGFEKLSRAAIRLSPGEPDLIAHYGIRIATSGDWKRGAELIQQAIAMNPQQYPEWYKIPLILGNYIDGNLETALKLSADISPIGLFNCDFFAAMIHGRTGNVAAAQEAAGRLLRDFPAVSDHFYWVFRVWRVPEDHIRQFAAGLIQAGITLRGSDRGAAH
jgi:adenylate cyclase